MLGGEHHERGETHGLVVRRAGTTVLAEWQTHLLARRPDRVERGIEEELRTRVQRRHQDADEALLLRPVDVAHGLVDVVERHQRLAVQPAGCFGAEVDHPAVERHVGLPGLLRVGRVVDAARREGSTVPEQDLGHHALALEVGDAPLRVPLSVLAELRSNEPVGHALEALQPFVERAAPLRVDVVAVALTRRLDMAVDRDDRHSSHRSPP